MDIKSIKERVGQEAVKFVKQGMNVGLGSGTTAAYFIQHLGQKCQEGLKIQAVASSEESAQLAKRHHIPLVPLSEITSLDLTVDGADQIDPSKQMIKGLGGALVREKILASMSHEMIVIVDESKLVHQLSHILPVEIIPFGHLATLHKLEKLGYKGKWRTTQPGTLFVTDNQNYILDIHFDKPRDFPRQDHEDISRLPGVVDTGFFFDLAGRVIIGFKDGQVMIR